MEYIEENIIRCEYSRRGGGIEIGLDGFLNNNKNYKMSAYQNYLGGGMLGSVQGATNCPVSSYSTKTQKRLYTLQEALKRYFHQMTNKEANDWDSWSSSDYEANQNRPESAY